MGRHSIRSFRPDPVEKSLLLTLADAAQQAPSASNLQAWRFLFITDQQLKEKVDLFSPGLSGKPLTSISCASLDGRFFPTCTIFSPSTRMSSCSDFSPVTTVPFFNKYFIVFTPKNKSLFMILNISFFRQSINYYLCIQKYFEQFF